MGFDLTPTDALINVPHQLARVVSSSRCRTTHREYHGFGGDDRDADDEEDGEEDDRGPRAAGSTPWHPGQVRPFNFNASGTVIGELMRQRAVGDGIGRAVWRGRRERRSSADIAILLW